MTQSGSITHGRQRSFGLDVVRAAAITLVLVSHYGVLVPAWRGYSPLYAVAVLGSMGVGLFFVLSGFLIGRLLIEVVERAPTYENLGIFLLRRWMRTVPLYVAWLCISVVFFPPHDDIGWHFLRYLTFTQNVAWPMPKSGWFAVSWSLTIEEWFYVLFGLSVIVCTRFQRGLQAFRLPLCLFLVVPAALRWQVPDTADWNDMVTKIAAYRLDSIAYGVLLAVLLSARPRLFQRPALAICLGIAIIIGTWVSAATGTLLVPLHIFRTFFYTVLDVGSALLIAGLIAWTRCHGLVGRTVRGISDISYGLYVMHLTILQAAWHFLPSGFWQAVAGASFITVGAAALSWRYLEQPILRFRPVQTFTHIPSTVDMAAAQAD